MDRIFKLFLCAGALLCLAACTVNPATGQQQFAPFMPPSQEAAIGAQEHQKIMQAYGGPFENMAVEAYVRRIGARVTADTERPDVQYKFFVIDTPVVNAFALPGGYIYVTRGLLAQADSEAEVAAVLAHETGHITARHSAERYSRGVVASLGAAVVAAATDSPSLANAADVGSDLYLKSYSRSQEDQADELGIRYLYKAGYDTDAMESFLANLDQYSKFEQRVEGTDQGESFSYFSTHPQTGERVAHAAAVAAQYPQNRKDVNRDGYLQAIDGLVYGDSAKQGLIRGQTFYHPQMGFTFTAPEGFRLVNQPENVIAQGPDGSVIIFDMAATPSGMEAYNYMTQVWMKGETLTTPESIMIGGMPAATAAFPGTVGNRRMTVRIVAIEWSPTKFFRFQMAVPAEADARFVDGLKKMTYSFRKMTDEEKQKIGSWKVRIVTAQRGDTAASLSARMPYPDLKEERFRSLNDLTQGQAIEPGQKYKIISEN